MTDEFDAFDDPRMGNPWLRYAVLCLNIVGAAYLLLGVVGGIGYGYVFSQDPNMGVVAGVLVGVVMFVFCAVVAIVNFVAAFFTQRKSKIGWVLGLILGGMYATSCCLPFGVVILVGMLNEKSRKIFLG